MEKGTETERPEENHIAWKHETLKVGLPHINSRRHPTKCRQIYNGGPEKSQPGHAAGRINECMNSSQ